MITLMHVYVVYDIHILIIWEADSPLQPLEQCLQKYLQTSFLHHTRFVSLGMEAPEQDFSCNAV